MLYGIIGILIIVIIFLYIKLNKKQQLDENALLLHQTKINELSAQELEAAKKLATTNADLTYAQIHLNTIQNQTDKAVKSYNELVQKINEENKKKNDELEQYFETRKINIEKTIEDEKNLKQQNLELWYNEQVSLYDQQNENVKAAAAAIYEECKNKTDQIIKETDILKQRYESLIAPLKKYEMEKQQRLYYTIQVPDEYKDDIEFLVTTVSQKVSHPDIINKLVWSEYVKPYLDETFKRVGIRDESGIYKITNIDSGKSYIGKSTNIKKRLSDHFKSSIGISTIADQAVHHEIWKTGFWNWTIEPIIYCDKDKLNEMEKYYINFFDTVNNGFNKNSGGGG